MVDDRICKLVSVEGFHQIVDEYIKETHQVKGAYEMAEAEYVDNFGFRRYKDYDSYRVARNRFLKK